jgi:hypothetical protein
MTVHAVRPAAEFVIPIISVATGPRHGRPYFGTVIKTDVFACPPLWSIATAPMLCVPFVIFFLCQVVAQKVTFVHAAS